MKTPPKALGVKTQTEPSHSWLSGLLLPGQTADPPAERLLGRPQHVPGRRRRNAPLVPAPPTARSHGARQPEIIPGQPSLPGNRQDLWGLQGLRDRSRCSAEAWWRRFAGKYAVAVAFVGARKGPDRIAPPFRLQLFCMPDWKNKLFFGDNLGLLNSRGAPGHAPIPSKRATHWHHPAFPCSIPRTCIESNPAPIIQTRRGRRSRRSARRGWAGPRLRSGGRRAPDTKRATHRRHPAVQCSIQEGHDFQADFYEARRPLLWSMRNCSKTAPGDTSRRYPHLRRFQGCAREKVGSGRRDLVKRSVTFLGFRVSGNPTSSLWQRN